MTYGVTLAIFVVIDIAWLTVMGPRLYRPALGDLLLPQVNLKAAFAFYLLYPAGLVIFAVSPALKSGELATAAIMGALFGFFCYATYDLTNQATLRNWTTTVTLADIAWGTFVSGVAAVGAAWVGARLG
jgi:uncharacterized membrane protein